MPLHYGNQNWDSVLPVLEELGEWFSGIIKYVFYPEDFVSSGDIRKSELFTKWLVRAHREESIQPEIVEKLTLLQQDLYKIADNLIDQVAGTGQKPALSSFNDFMTLYDEFTRHIRRLENDLVMEGSGYDAFTGLRSKKMFKVDIEMELERLARQGKNFCVALVKLDRFDEMLRDLDVKEVDGYIKLVASLIKISMRTYDDAYYYGKDEFILSLKQADLQGGVSALERLKKEVERQDIKVQFSGDKQRHLSMSCCIAEPVSEDVATDLVRDLRRDLERVVDDTGDGVLRYHELSPIQRYVQGEH